MKVLTPSLDLHGFLARLALARTRVLMLDYDGTLAPFHVRPEHALPYPGVAQALEDLMKDGGTRVVIVSGRRVTEIVPLLALDPHPEIWGCHGWERLLPDGKLHTQSLSTHGVKMLEEAAHVAQGLVPGGIRIECKTASVALHWRGLALEQIESVRERTLAAWTPLAARNDMELLRFDGGLELRTRGCNKQNAAKAILSEAGPDSAIAYLGDDVTDEDAFAVTKPRGIAVLVRPEFRETAADVWLRPPDELLSFISRWRVQKGAA